MVITVPTGQDLQINLTNNLSFATGSGTNNIPTSLTIVGQLGGGLGSTGGPRRRARSHGAQTVTWPVGGDPGDSVNNPPPQGPRVQSFCDGSARRARPPSLDLDDASAPGTYLLESGTHPSIQGPMGLYRHAGCHRRATGATGSYGHGLSGRDLQRRCSAAVQRNRSGPEQARSTRRSTPRVSARPRSGPDSPAGAAIRPRRLQHLLSAGGELHAALLPHQRRRLSTRPTPTHRCSSPRRPGNVRHHRNRAGAPGERRPAHARAVDRRSADWSVRQLRVSR